MSARGHKKKEIDERKSKLKQTKKDHRRKAVKGEPRVEIIKNRKTRHT